MKKNIVITKNKEGKIINGRLSLTKDISKILNLTPESRNILIKFYSNKLTLTSLNEEIAEIEEIKRYTENEMSYYKGVLVANYDKNRNSYKLNIPFFLLKQWNLEEKKSIELKVFENEIVLEEFKEEVLTQNRLKGIFTFKVEKGGIGKTFLSVQIAAGLAGIGYKVLLLTSDPQNNALDISLKAQVKDGYLSYITYNKEHFSFSNAKGLKYWLNNGNGNLLELRENLYYIPLEAPIVANNKFATNLNLFFEEMKKQYDYIIIDSVPTRKVDELILHHTTKLIIPAYGDKLTVNGIIKVIDEVGVEKVAAIIFNKFEDTSVEKQYYDEIKSQLEGSGIYFPKPIKNLSSIKQLLDKSKTIWESGDKKIKEVQEIMQDILERLIIETDKSIGEK